jgi:hypothetical protein
VPSAEQAAAACLQKIANHHLASFDLAAFEDCQVMVGNLQ